MKRFLRNLWSGKGFGWRAARVTLLAYIGLVIFVMAFEDSFIFFPSKYPEGIWNTRNILPREGEIIPKIEDCYFTTSDGVKLHGWFCIPHRSAGGALTAVPAEMVLLWFHGNAGNVSHRYEMIEMLMQLPARVFIIDYRGYGRSEGKPSEEGLYRDADAAWNYLVKERGIGADRIIIFGKSLGGVPAIDLAARVNPAGLVVQSSFTSVADMAAAVLPFFPGFLLRTKMDSISKIRNVTCPKLFIHSPADEVVPYRLGRRLYDAAPEPKRFYEVANAGHNATYLIGGKPYLETLRAFVQSCAPKS
ncbi:MAG TPA: alpha/beta hydrolase [Blastocatellia bacterium]|nr:alpha/beta hydrolase [Blastocatellia bacterium]